MVVLAYEAAIEYQQQALATSTHQQYLFHVQQFAEFCAITGVGPVHHPPEAALCANVAYLARSNLRHSTVQQYLKGLRHYFARGGYSEFASRVHWPQLYHTLKGIKRADHRGSAKKAPVSPDMLLAYKQVLTMSRPADVAIWACVLISFIGFFRKSNTTVAGGALDTQGSVCEFRMWSSWTESMA